MRQMQFYKPLAPEEILMDRFANLESHSDSINVDIWPDGKMRDAQAHRVKPYITWYFPKEKKTDAIQIIYSGGAYMGNDPMSFEVAPARKLLNDLGMTVVTLR